MIPEESPRDTQLRLEMYRRLDLAQCQREIEMSAAAVKGEKFWRTPTGNKIPVHVVSHHNDTRLDNIEKRLILASHVGRAG